MIIRRRAARALTHTNGAGLAVVDYSGLLTETGFDDLREQVMDQMMEAQIAVVDMSTVVPLSANYGGRATAGLLSKAKAHTAAMIVQPAQLALWTKYALKCAMLGICRVPFVSKERAIRWAEERLP